VALRTAPPSDTEENCVPLVPPLPFTIKRLLPLSVDDEESCSNAPVPLPVKVAPFSTFTTLPVALTVVFVRVASGPASEIDAADAAFPELVPDWTVRSVPFADHPVVGAV